MKNRVLRAGRGVLIVLTLLAIIALISPAYSNEIFEVKRVIDGDTLLLDNGERVRLIGVDTPEQSGDFMGIDLVVFGFYRLTFEKLNFTPSCHTPNANLGFLNCILLP